MMNVSELIQSRLGEVVIRRIAESLNLDEQVVAGLIRKAIPVLVALVAARAGDPEKGSQITREVEQADEGIFDHLEDFFAGDNGETIRQGKSFLGSVLGGDLTDILSTLARNLGQGEGKMGSLLGILVPVLLGAVKKEAGGGSGGVAESEVVGLLGAESERAVREVPDELREPLGLVSGSEDSGGEQDVRPEVMKSYLPKESGAGGPKKGLLIPGLAVLALVAVLVGLWTQNKQDKGSVGSSDQAARIDDSVIEGRQVNGVVYVPGGAELSARAQDLAEELSRLGQAGPESRAESYDEMAAEQQGEHLVQLLVDLDAEPLISQSEQAEVVRKLRMANMKVSFLVVSYVDSAAAEGGSSDFREAAEVAEDVARWIVQLLGEGRTIEAVVVKAEVLPRPLPAAGHAANPLEGEAARSGRVVEVWALPAKATAAAGSAETAAKF